MIDRSDTDDAGVDPVGLCRTCRHVRLVRNPRGNVFYMCQLSEIDPRFAKYPRLPVLRCIGYERIESESDQS